MSLLSRYVHDEECEKRLEWPGLRELSKKEGRCMHRACKQEGISKDGYHPDQCFYGCFCRKRQRDAKKERRQKRREEERKLRKTVRFMPRTVLVSKEEVHRGES